MTTTFSPLAHNTFKHSPALGATLALLGVRQSVPLLHGAQGCTAAAKVKLVSHFQESIPLATTAMDEVNTVLGGDQNVLEAIRTLRASSAPGLIGVCSTALTDTRGDDLQNALRRLRQESPELDDLPVVMVNSPDTVGGLQEGFAAAVTSLLKAFAEPGDTIAGQITVLASSALAPGDAQELRDLIESFGYSVLMVPDLADSLDGRLRPADEATKPLSAGGISVEQLRLAGRSERIVVVGDSLLPAAQDLAERCNRPLTSSSHLMTLGAVDELVAQLIRWSGRPVPSRLQRQRSQVLDALLDTHFFFGGKRVALALESDLMAGMSTFLRSTGAEIALAITPDQGDLGQLEKHAIGCDLVVAGSQAAGLSRRLGCPLARMGFPITDRLGQGLRISIGYAGLLRLLIDLGNQLLEQEQKHTPTHR